MSEAASKEATGSERRLWVRSDCDLKSSCRPLVTTADPLWGGSASNISCGGIALAVQRRFERNTLLNLEVCPGTSARSWSAVIRVVRVAPRPDGGWMLGCKFTSALSESEMQELLSFSEKD
jgi:hypothetical protein